jgi:hypothetical protein
MQMSRSSRQSQAKLGRQEVTSWINDFYRSKTTAHGLPEDVLVQALGGYGAGSLGWPSLRSKALDFQNYVATSVSDCTIRHVFPSANRQQGACRLDQHLSADGQSASTIGNALWRQHIYVHILARWSVVSFDDRSPIIFISA